MGIRRQAWTSLIPPELSNYLDGSRRRDSFSHTNARDEGEGSGHGWLAAVTVRTVTAKISVLCDESVCGQQQRGESSGPFSFATPGHTMYDRLRTSKTLAHNVSANIAAPRRTPNRFIVKACDLVTSKICFKYGSVLARRVI
jgi:hypothetical protein